MSSPRETGMLLNIFGKSWRAHTTLCQQLTLASRLIFASGALDLSKDNENELVNPGGKRWTWRTVADVAKETKGHPVYSW